MHVQGDGPGGRNATSGVLWAVATATAYSFSSVLGKDLLAVLGPPSLLFWRFGISSVVLWGVLAVWHRHGGPDPLAVPKRRALLVGVMFGYMVFTGFKALEHLNASVYIVVVYIYPVLVVIASSVMGHHVSRNTWLALGVVMAGVVLTVPELFGGVGSLSTLGVMLTLLQAVLMATFMIVSSRLLPGLDGVVQSAWTVLGATLAMLPLLATGGLHVTHSGSRTAELLTFAVVTGSISTICFFRAMRHVAPGVVAMIMTAEVALAVLWSVYLLGEKVRGVKILGATVVISGVLFAQWTNVREARSLPGVVDTVPVSPPVA
jgi:drug/metabolite transporter (DMT)-like permease